METVPESEKQSAKDLRLTNRALLPFLIAGVAIILIRYARWDVVALTPLAVALMWAASCLISGVAIGFLFCIPRVVEPGAGGTPANGSTDMDEKAGGRPSTNGATARGSSAYRQQVNSNLVEISDWLTKIIVGLGLVNLQEIPGWLAGSAQVLAEGLANEPDCTKAAPCAHYAFAIALIVAFSVLGFLMGYLYTRLFLAGAFRRADSSALEQAVDEELERIPGSEAGQTVTDAAVAVAQRVRDRPEAQDRFSAVAALRDLAQQYERLRRFSLPGAERTREMTRVLIKMRALALAAYDELPVFANSASPGERLVAIAMLQMQPSLEYVDWLIQRIGSETPFMQYAAIEALRRAALKFRIESDRQILVDKLRNWLQSPEGIEFMRGNTDRVDLMRSVLSELGLEPSQPSG
jgi:hypothetical protein